MLDKQKLTSSFKDAVAQTVEEAKANTTSYGEALKWIDNHFNAQREPTDAELQSRPAMLAIEFIRMVYRDASQQLKEEALGLPFAKTD